MSFFTQSGSPQTEPSDNYKWLFHSFHFTSPTSWDLEDFIKQSILDISHTRPLFHLFLVHLSVYYLGPLP